MKNQRKVRYRTFQLSPKLPWLPTSRSLNWLSASSLSSSFHAPFLCSFRCSAHTASFFGTHRSIVAFPAGLVQSVWRKFNTGFQSDHSLNLQSFLHLTSGHLSSISYRSPFLTHAFPSCPTLVLSEPWFWWFATSSHFVPFFPGDCSISRYLRQFKKIWRKSN